MSIDYTLTPIGIVRSYLKRLEDAPKQGHEGAPDAWIELDAAYTAGLEGVKVGSEIIVITWLHQASRDMLQVHPRGNKNLPLTGVFGTRSPHRPNPLGIHRVKVLAIEGTRLKVGPLEALDGTPVVDIKSAMPRDRDA
ncbi:MAG: tRNA (N6-threonylcarbamoyladenosine(37)-N6)-methyltransferase TrmO [Nitrospiraceae bacterium]|nr:tRNA (N6-threonylcarbamoyladenosine(37)-N6)-methyltransferase TrmO [Nitrospiraceae bacterium]